MRKLILLMLLPALSFSQSIQVDQDRYTAQELIEEVLIQSDCITDVVVTNVSGANFTDGSKSFGYFDAAGTGFPISNGLVLSTGKLETISCVCKNEFTDLDGRSKKCAFVRSART